MSKKQPTIGVMATGGSVVTADKFTSLFDKTVKQLKKESKNRNFILFIHGRGDHPRKAKQKKLLERLEKEYSAKVIMFHWPSKSDWFGFPEEEARGSAGHLLSVIKQLQKYKESNQKKVKGISINLLTHSMGSFVLEELVSSGTINQCDNLFDTVLISASASASSIHAKWVKNLNIARNVYITFNESDAVLTNAGILRRSRCLGKGLQTSTGKEFELSDNCKYLDISNTGVNHRYYLKSGQNKNKYLTLFYQMTLNGKSINLDAYDGTESVSRDRIYQLKSEMVNPWVSGEE